ncbi:CRISPR-associated protein Cmr4 [Paenibacillus forsythiae]|uniref:CRISPR-associated protein Cmr4 n=1 Tax=Paenibacillus forsythiae TaxID=365616 RepID=A0ABU3H5R9_9BACL|nr:type III-B CRISPR module RAMP protein Cmr4 [Paenibacillus forsythiae]MDT3426164.1 CRISPR-associated protein Cmr4 [Paenibacillus forsythiae]
MSANSKMYFIHCLSPVHVGAGQGVGDIDLPIVRERTTEWPYVPGSSVKGVQRRYYSRLAANGEDPEITPEWVEALFGRAEGERHDDAGPDEGIAGALVLTDSRLLAFPVASHYGVFAYVTCPSVLRRVIRDSEAVGADFPPLDMDALDARLDADPHAAFVYPFSKLLKESNEQESDGTEESEVILDEFSFIASRFSDEQRKWVDWCADQLFPGQEMNSERSIWRKRLIVVADEAFQYFVTLCCEVTPRIRIRQETKVVDQGALWYEEYLPSETVLYGLVWCDSIHHPNLEPGNRNALGKLRKNVSLQLGANVSVGKGRIRYLLSTEEGTS